MRKTVPPTDHPVRGTPTQANRRPPIRGVRNGVGPLPAQERCPARRLLPEVHQVTAGAPARPEQGPPDQTRIPKLIVLRVFRRCAGRKHDAFRHQVPQPAMNSAYKTDCVTRSTSAQKKTPSGFPVGVGDWRLDGFVTPDSTPAFRGVPSHGAVRSRGPELLLNAESTYDGRSRPDEMRSGSRAVVHPLAESEIAIDLGGGRGRVARLKPVQPALVIPRPPVLARQRINAYRMLPSPLVEGRQSVAARVSPVRWSVRATRNQTAGTIRRRLSRVGPGRSAGIRR